ncbi:MAG: hypothetical protein R2800_15150 [Flavipsychrobacter sp.]
MKHILAIALLISISYQFVAKMGVIAWYEINKEYIAAELCENKDKPQLQCNGKCYLKKQIDKVEDSGDATNKNLPTKNKKTELSEYVLTTQVLCVCYTSKDIVTFHDKYNAPRGTQYITSVFHPPQPLV